MDALGWLVWWRVGSVALTPKAAEVMMSELGLAAVKQPSHVAPIDAFRRLGGKSATYTLPDGHDVSLDLYPAESQDTMLVRHIVRTVKRDGVNVQISRVGEVAFYKPPRGKPSKARVRVQVGKTSDPQVAPFAETLRKEYDRALTYLDDQAGRRLVRSYLASVSAVWLGGPYFIAKEDDADRLLLLFDRLGGTSWCHSVMLNDTPYHRAVVAGWEGKEESDGG